MSEGAAQSSIFDDFATPPSNKKQAAFTACSLHQPLLLMHNTGERTDPRTPPSDPQIFPEAPHIETVILLVQQKLEDTIEVDRDLDEPDNGKVILQGSAAVYPERDGIDGV